MTFDTDDEPKELFYPLAIENKVYSNEGENQTVRCWNAICQNLNEYPIENRGKGIATARKHVPNGTFISMPTNCFLSKVEAKGLCA